MITPQNELRTVLPVVGWAAQAAETVSFTGGTDPILPTPFELARPAPFFHAEGNSTVGEI